MRKRRRERECNEDKEVRINPRKFFKIILHRTLQCKTLRIPAAVAKEIKAGLPTEATLRIRSGMTWKIRLEKMEKEVWFTRGMAEFMEQNGIELGYFLELEYDGNQEFKVYIFDLSCTEIHYPIPTIQMDMDMDMDDHSFTITVRKTTVSSNCYLRFPKPFCDKHEEITLKRSVTLQTSDGKKWHFESCYLYDGAIRLIGKSWKEFVHKNHWDKHIGANYKFLLLDKTCHTVLFKVIKE